jgi:hypothetical protein
MLPQSRRNHSDADGNVTIAANTQRDLTVTYTICESVDTPRVNVSPSKLQLR